MEKSIKVFAPATVANVACGFDILGMALQYPGDEVSVKVTHDKRLAINNLTPYKEIPEAPERNTAGVAVMAMLEALNSHQGFEISILKKIKPGSGVGSSAASSAAAVFAVNQLLGNPFSKEDLVKFAMQGESAACGAAHADNVAPAIMGGFVLVRSYTPLDLVKLPYPDELYCAIVHPQIELKTEDARKVLRRDIQLKDAVVQWGNIAGLVAGLYEKNYELIGRSLQDVIIEPVRSLLIPGYEAVKKAAIDAGALGCSISGSGPSMFSLAKDQQTASTVAHAMQAAFADLEVETNLYISKINADGVLIVG